MMILLFIGSTSTPISAHYKNNVNVYYIYLGPSTWIRSSVNAADPRYTTGTGEGHIHPTGWVDVVPGVDLCYNLCSASGIGRRERHQPAGSRATTVSTAGMVGGIPPEGRG